MFVLVHVSAVLWVLDRHWRRRNAGIRPAEIARARKVVRYEIRTLMSPAFVCALNSCGMKNENKNKMNNAVPHLPMRFVRKHMLTNCSPAADVCVWMCTIAGKTAKSFQEAAGEFKTELQKGMEEDTADALEATKDDSPGEVPPSED